jgi:membrane-bound acyltransferase YfiQ involved in biofilm formation
METQERRVDRRKGPDIWIKSLTWFGIIGWIFMLITMAVFHLARPERDKSISGFLQKRLSGEWDSELVNYFIILSVIILVISTIGLIINSQRLNRKNDRYRMSLIFLVAFTILGLIYYLI